MVSDGEKQTIFVKQNMEKKTTAGIIIINLGND